MPALLPFNMTPISHDWALVCSVDRAKAVATKGTLVQRPTSLAFAYAVNIRGGELAKVCFYSVFKRLAKEIFTSQLTVV